MTDIKELEIEKAEAAAQYVAAWERVVATGDALATARAAQYETPAEGWAAEGGRWRRKLPGGATLSVNTEGRGDFVASATTAGNGSMAHGCVAIEDAAAALCRELVATLEPYGDA